MNRVLKEWNEATEEAALDAMLACCGARRWAAAMVALRPIHDVVALSTDADRVWATMSEADWLEAFSCHPRIGERKARASAQSVAWSRQEQAGAENAEAATLEAMVEANARYEERFGFTYIVCATGKSVEEMLDLLQRRLQNEREQELREAAEQQRLILQIRLGKWLMQ